MLDIYDELKNLVSGFAENRIAYALCGGLALAVHGITRATVDIDVLVPDGAVTDAMRVARGLGFTVDAAPMSFAGGSIQIRRLSKLDPESGDILSLDLLLVTPRLQGAWESRDEIEWENERLWVVSRAGLIELKSLRKSGQDLDDIEGLKGHENED